MLRLPHALGLLVLLTACDRDVCPESPEPPGESAGETGGEPEPSGPLYIERTWTHLPPIHYMYRTMEARAADFDGDGDLDLLLAQEWAPNSLLLNQLAETGEPRFIDASDRIPQVTHDSEDIAVGDFDGDGDLDAVVVSEDDLVNELYINQGDVHFVAGSLPVTGKTNAIAAADISGDGRLDLILGNDGQNFALINQGNGSFVDETATRLPAFSDVTQDVVLGDLDQDGDLDLVFGNEQANRVLLDQGGGVFEDLPDALEPTPANEETRNVDLADIDADGDLDLFFANVAWVPNTDPRDRLLFNDGSARFTTKPGTLPVDTALTLDGDFHDLDLDGDPDLVLSFLPFQPYRALLNDGSGSFSDATAEVFPLGVMGEGIEVEGADFSGDGVVDLYLAAFSDADRLLIHR